MSDLERVRQQVWAGIEAGIDRGIRPVQGMFGVEFDPEHRRWVPYDKIDGGCCGIGLFLVSQELTGPCTRKEYLSLSMARVLLEISTTQIDSFVAGWDGDSHNAFDAEFWELGRELEQKARERWALRKAGTDGSVD